MLKESLKQTLQVAVESEEFQVAQQLIQILTSLKVEKKPFVNPIKPFQPKLELYGPLKPPVDNEPTIEKEELTSIVRNVIDNKKYTKLSKRKVSDYRDAMLDLFTSDRWQSGNVTSSELYECLAKDFAKRWEDFPTEFESEKLSGGSARWVTYVSQVLGKDEQIRQCFRKPTSNKNMYIFRK